MGLDEQLTMTVINCIYRSGHSRIPVYEKKKDNLVGVLFVKDQLVEDNISVRARV